MRFVAGCGSPADACRGGRVVHVVYVVVKKTYYEETQINWISGPVGTGHELRQGQRHGHLYTETSTLTKVIQ